jgi:type I restriction enzyme S subunit
MNYDFKEDGVKIVKITQLHKNGFLDLTNCSFVSRERVQEFENILIKDRDILMCLTGGTIGKIIRVGNVNEPLLQNYRVGHFSSAIKNRICDDFIFWVMSSEYLVSQIFFQMRETGQPNIGMDDFGRMKITLPPISEQQSIANYLDHKTTQIDILISKKQQFIALLQEERIAVINQAVTKGLDSSVKMKDSGIEWLGVIPEHWEVKKLGFIFKSLNTKRIPLSAEERGVMNSRIYDYYGASGVIDKVENFLFDEDLILIGEDGANLLTRSKRLVFIASGKYWVNNHAHIIKPINGNINYYCEFLELIDYSVYVSGSAQPKLTQEALMSIKIIEPPLIEQNNIYSFVKTETEKIDTIISKTQQEIELLKEYKIALISEVVTGKVDVREEVLN